jgi:PTH1 family peptidyl-tRNA hydrolase
MKIIVGLGNPGKQYQENRHNIGFKTIDKIAEDYEFSEFVSKFSSLYSEGFINHQKIKLLKPQTFMNNSGLAVQKIKQFFKVDAEDILVIHDELDLKLGKVRVKIGGSAGGHNGLKSIDKHIGKTYWRLRFGIDHPGMKEKVSGYVLSNFTSDEEIITEKINQSISQNIELLLNKESEKFMSKVAMGL